MCYEPLRFSPIFRRFVNSRESRVGFTADSSQPHNQKRLCSRTIVFVLWCVLDCFTQSRAFPQTTPPSLCILHTLSTKTPLSSRAQPRGWKSPRGDFTKTQLPDSIGLSVTRVLTPIGYIALQFDSGGGAQQCFCLRLSLVSLSLSVSSFVSVETTLHQ